MPRMSRTSPSCAAIVPGVRRMPIPIALPKVTAMPKLTPRMRSNLPLCSIVVRVTAETDVIGFRLNTSALFDFASALHQTCLNQVVII